MSEPKEGFGLWIPGAVLSRADISLEEKCLYGLLEVLDDGKGCWASNEWLASRLSVSERAIQRYLARLEEVGLVIKVINEAAGNQRRVQTVGVQAVATPSRQSVVTLTPICRPRVIMRIEMRKIQNPYPLFFLTARTSRGLGLSG